MLAAYLNMADINEACFDIYSCIIRYCPSIVCLFVVAIEGQGRRGPAGAQTVFEAVMDISTGNRGQKSARDVEKSVPALLKGNVFSSRRSIGRPVPSPQWSLFEAPAIIQSLSGHFSGFCLGFVGALSSSSSCLSSTKSPPTFTVVHRL
jgi:hypothetical protein